MAEMKSRLRASRRWSPIDMTASGLSLRLAFEALGNLTMPVPPPRAQARGAASSVDCGACCGAASVDWGAACPGWVGWV